MPGNTRGWTRHFTLEEVQLANRLRFEEHLEWDVIVRRIGDGVLESSLRSTVSTYRKGLWHPKRQRSIPLREKLEVAVTELGVTEIETLAQFFQVGVDSISYHLKQMGLDREMRKEVRREFDLLALQSMMKTERAAA